ncbi:MAG: hypothetical protein QXP53_00125 [Candidatus Pacearchaeota archaeon]
MTELIPDTNFLIYLARFKLFDELDSLGYKILVPRIVDFELEKVSQDKNQKMEDRNAAILAQTILKKWVELKKARYIEIEGENVDNAILEFAKKKKAIVATMDSELREKLKKEGIKTLILRQEKYFVID